MYNPERHDEFIDAIEAMTQEALASDTPDEAGKGLAEVAKYIAEFDNEHDANSEG